MGNYNTTNRKQEISVKLQSNKKRPRQIEEHLITTNPRTALNHLIALNYLVNSGCVVKDSKFKLLPTPKVLNKFLAESDWSSHKTQNSLACLVKKILKNFGRDSEGIPFGNKSLQKVFHPIRELSKGANGVTMITGYKGSEPFAILKSTGDYEGVFKFENNLHEIVVGLLLNNLRKEIPNFMYLYGGFYCAPPLLLQKVFQEWRVIEETREKIGEIYRLPSEFWRLEQIDEMLNPEERNPIFKAFHDKMKVFQDTYAEDYHVAKKINTAQYLAARIKLFQELIEEWKVSGRAKTEIEDVFISKLEFLKGVKAEDIDKMKEISEREPKLKFDVNNLCNSEEDKTTLALYEYVSDAVLLKDFVGDKNVSNEDKIRVMNAIFLAYWTAFKRYHFVHHDLHPGNVLVKKIKEEKRVVYFKDTDDEVSITSKYIPVIIDYGMVDIMWNGLRLESLNQDLYNETEKSFTLPQRARRDFEILTGILLGYDEGDEKLADFGEEYNSILKQLLTKEKTVEDWLKGLMEYIKKGK